MRFCFNLKVCSFHYKLNDFFKVSDAESIPQGLSTAVLMFSTYICIVPIDCRFSSAALFLLSDIFHLANRSLMINSQHQWESCIRKSIIEIQYFAALRWGEEEEIMMFLFSVTILTQTQTIIFTTSKIDRNWKYIFVRKLTVTNYNIYSIF